MASKANAAGTITYVRTGGTYTPALLSNIGDVFQKYSTFTAADAASKKGATATGVTPDFRTTPATVFMDIMSSKTGKQVLPATVEWYLDSQTTKINFGTDNLSTNVLADGESGHFKFVKGSSTERYALQIVKNTVAAMNAMPFTLYCKAGVQDGNDSFALWAKLTVAISKAVESKTIVVISTAKGGRITSVTGDGSSDTLTARCFDASGGEITSGLTYRWSKAQPDGTFSDLAGKTAKTLAVGAADVDGSEIFKVTVSKDNSVIGSDIQQVDDVTDPLIIDPGPDGSESLTEGETVTGGTTLRSIKYNPQIRERGSSTVLDSKDKQTTYTFSMTFYDSAGNELQNDTPFECTQAMCAQAGTIVNYLITATKKQ